MRERVCSNCGGKKYKVVGQNMVKCQFCGTLYVDEASSKEEEFLIVSANEKARECKFEEAIAEYNKVISLYPMSFSAYYGKALAKNKIIFYTNEKGTSKKPCFFGDEINSILEDKDFKKALEYAPPEVVKTYNYQAKRIDKIANLYKEKEESKNYDVLLYSMEYNKDDENDFSNMILNRFKELNFSVYFVQATINENEERTFRALQTCKAVLLVANKEEGYATESIKNIYDRYKYLISQKKKTNSSFLILLDKDKVAYKNLPFDKTFENNVFDISSISVIEDLITRVKNELSKTVNETARIDTINVEKVVPEKKKYVDLNAVEPVELGHYNVKNSKLSETHKVKWIYLSIKNKDFESAREIVDEELAKDPNNYELLFADLLIENKITTEEEFFTTISNFRNKEKIDKVLEYAPKEFAESFVDSWEDLIIKLDSEEYYNAFLIYLAQYETPNRDKIIEAAENKAIETLDEDLIDKVLKCFKKEEVDRFVKFYFMLAQKSGDQKYYKKVLDIDEGHEQSNVVLLLKNFKTKEDILTYKNKTEIEDIFQYLSDESREAFVNSVIKMIMPLAFLDLSKTESQLDFYLSYISNNSKFIEILEYISSQFQEMGFFTLAEKYISIAISKDKENSKLYWKLIQIKSHCKGDNDFVTSKVNPTKFPEWETLLTYASDEDTEKYVAITSKVNLYKGKKKVFESDMFDKNALKEKINDFLSRNNKVLLDIYKQEGDKVAIGVDYFKSQLKPFEKYINDIDKCDTFEEYKEINRKLFQRLSAMDLTLDMSISVTALVEKDKGLNPFYKTETEKKLVIEKEKAEKRNEKFIRRFIFIFLECFPMLFATILFLTLTIQPKEVYMYFSFDFLAVTSIFSLVLGFVNFWMFLRKKTKSSDINGKFNFALWCVSGINLVLLTLGMYFIPQTISIDNEKEFKLLMNNANNANFALSRDMDLKNIEWNPKTFSGVLDGKGHKILNLKFKEKDEMGLFKENNGIIKNLVIELAKVENYNNVFKYGTIAVVNHGEISNCSIVGELHLRTADNLIAGGFVSIMEGGTIKNSKSQLRLFFDSNKKDVMIGGVAGLVLEGKEDTCITKVDSNSQIYIKNSDAKNVCIGGVIGKIGSITKSGVNISVNRSAAIMIIEGKSQFANIGGFAAYSESVIHDNEIYLNVNTENWVGDGNIAGIFGIYKNSDLHARVKHNKADIEVVRIEETDKFKIASLVTELKGMIEQCFTISDYKFCEVNIEVYEPRRCYNIKESNYEVDLELDTKIWNIPEGNYPALIFDISK